MVCKGRTGLDLTTTVEWDGQGGLMKRTKGRSCFLPFGKQSMNCTNSNIFHSTYNDRSPNTQHWQHLHCGQQRWGDNIYSFWRKTLSCIGWSDYNKIIFLFPNTLLVLKVCWWFLAIVFRPFVTTLLQAEKIVHFDRGLLTPGFSRQEDEAWHGLFGLLVELRSRVMDSASISI